MDSLKGISQKTIQYISRLMPKEQRYSGLQYLLSEIKAWQPLGSSGDVTFHDEMRTRLEYLNASMQADALKVIKRYARDTWEDLRDAMVNIKLVQHIILERAQMFPDGTAFYLRDIKTKEKLPDDDPNQKAFQEMVQGAHLHTMLSNINAMVELMTRAAGKAWFDSRGRKVRVAAYPQHKVHIMPNPFVDWDVYGAIVYMFQRPGVKGIKSNPRYEVWYDKDLGDDTKTDEWGNKLFTPTGVYLTDGYNEWQFNANDENPFRDQLTDEPIVPFTWFSNEVLEDAGIYSFGQEDLLTANRVINWGLTGLNNNLVWQSFGIPTWEIPEGTSAKNVLPINPVISPRHGMQIPPGVKFRFERPDLDVSGPMSFYELLAKLEVQFSNLDPAAIVMSGEGTREASGYALKVRMYKLTKYTKRQRPLYVDPVHDIMVKMIVVNNYHAAAFGLHSFDLSKYEPYWQAAEVEVPVDSKELADKHITRIQYNASTAAHLYAEEHSVDLETAKNAIEENRKFNAENRSAMDFGIPDNMADEALKKIFDEDGKPVEQKPKDPEPTPKEPESGAAPEKQQTNVYQLVKAIDAGAATAVDLRMLLFPNEDRATAQRMIASNEEFNREMARIRAEVAAIEANTFATEAPNIAPDASGKPKAAEQQMPDTGEPKA